LPSRCWPHAVAARRLRHRPAGAPTVKVTPLGTHAGELCNRDRAMIFEDPTGVRVLYDAGASVLGGTTRASASSTSCC
jgi:hypothetical protein